MSLQILLPNVDASAVNLGFLAPVKSGLQYFSFLGTQASLTENLANASTAQKIGSPVVNGLGLGAELGHANHISTGVMQTNEFTFIVTMKLVAENRIYFGCYGSNPSNMNLRRDNANMLFSFNTGNLTTGIPLADYNVGDVVTFAVVGRNPAGVADTTINTIEIYELSRNKTNKLVNASHTVSMAAQPMKIGGAYGAGWNSLDPSTFYHAAVWNRRLNIAEIQTHYAVLKKYYAKFGVNV